MKKAHYDILGVDKNASKTDILKAYREKSRQFHPDKGGSNEMMGLLNEAKKTILDKLNNDSSVNDISLQEDDGNLENEIESILSKSVFEGLDNSENRMSKKYIEQHTTLVAKHALEGDIANIRGIDYFDRFETELYCDFALEEDQVIIDEHTDLFKLIINKESANLIGEEIDESSLKTLTPHVAISHFIKFVEGKYFGKTLIKVQQFFRAHSSKFNDIAEYNLYSGILEVMSIRYIKTCEEGRLLLSLDKILDYIRVNCTRATSAMPEYAASLLQNVYFRTLFSHALHLFWMEQSYILNSKDRAEMVDIAATRKCFINIARQVVVQHKVNFKDDDLLNSAAFLKRLYDFEKHFLNMANEDNNPDWYRQRGYGTLDWISRLIPYATRKILINILIQAGTYFQEASACARAKDRRVAKADQKLAFRAFMEAYSIAHSSSPDLEIYSLTNILKFVAAFRYQDDDIVEPVKALQKRLLNLVDVFPVYAGLQSNASLLVQTDNANLFLMRKLLYALIGMSHAKAPIDHDRITVLYHAYEACIKSWYQQSYDPDIENQFRLELMSLLLKDNHWNFSSLDEYLASSVMVARDVHNWMDIRRPLRIMNCGVPTYKALNGIDINYKTGEIRFILDDGSNQQTKRNRLNTLTIYDLMEMLEKNVMGASFSLDPIDPQMMYHPFNTMRFAPSDLYQTQFLNTMLLADYILKFFTIGEEVQGKYPYDMRPIKEMIKHLPKHLQRIIEDFHNSQHRNSGAIHRFWIEAEQISEATQEEENGIARFAMTDMKMVVKKHTMERDHHGNLVDTEKDDEGWDVYVLTPQQKRDIDAGRVAIQGPAMLIVPRFNTVAFVETDHIYKEDNLSLAQIDQIKGIEKIDHESNGKVKVTIDNSMYIYKLISGLSGASEVPTRFSPEYVFAQEFSLHYDEFSEYFPIFARLKELSRMTLAIRYLNMKQLETSHKKDYYSRMLEALPDWERRDSHPSRSYSYFSRPVEGSMLSSEEKAQALFRHEHSEKIRPLLPYNLYNKHLANTASIAEQTKIQKLTANSPEIEKICNDVYQENRDRIIREHGNETWDYNGDRIWREICDKKAEFARDINAAREKNIKEQLLELFAKALPYLPLGRITVLANNAMAGDFRGFAEELAKRELDEAKKQIRQLGLDQSRVLDSLKDIGLGREENKERALEGKCLWVPASVKHHVAANSSLFIYGGVRVLPKVNVIGNSDPRYSQTINNAFASQNRASINNSQLRVNNVQTQAIRSNSGSASSKTGTTFTSRMSDGLRKQGYQEHHVVSNKNSDTTVKASSILAKAGVSLDDRINKMFLPVRPGIHESRSIHDGRHVKVVNQSLQIKLETIDTLGIAHNWSKNQYRVAVIKILQRERDVLKSGERSLNKNKASKGRSQSPPISE